MTEAEAREIAIAHYRLFYGCSREIAAEVVDNTIQGKMAAIRILTDEIWRLLKLAIKGENHA